MRPIEQIRADVETAKAAPPHRESDGRYSGPESSAWAVNRLVKDVPDLLAELERLQAIEEQARRLVQALLPVVKRIWSSVKPIVEGLR